MLDPVVHAALVTLCAWLVRLLFAAIGLDLGDEIATQLAQIIVAYILSLFGYGLWLRATARSAIAGDRWYTPPFTK